jgi:glutathione S-transferase
MIELYQAEWCPYSSAVRERLTELGLPFVAIQVEPEQEQRTQVGEIPVLVDENGNRHTGTREVFEFLKTLPAGDHEQGHRDQYAEHADMRRNDETARVLEKLAPLG